NPFKDRDGFDVMVRTGDLGRRLPDGSLLFLERKDWMVNINGQRVEPGEIAGVMSGIPGVVQAAVKDFEGSDGQTFLCAYYVAAGDVGEGDVRDYLKGKLPAYMVPAYLMRLDRMPLNASGKVDRRSLPDPTAPGSGSEPTAEPAGFEENAVTRGVREILKSITGRGDYRYDENLLHCGLSSLTAIKFTSEVMGRFGVDLDVTSMLGGCSVASLSDDIIGKLVEGTTKASASKPSKDMYPLTKTQLGVYVQCYANPQSVMYNIPMHVRYDAARLEGKDLAAAVRKVVEAHPCLKCTIGPDARGEACMIPHPGAEVRIEEREGSEEELAAFRDGFVRPFDLSESLYRICVFRTEGAVDLFLDFSHIMFDGSSGLIFMQDLEDALSGSEVSPERFTMLDVSDEEAERAESGEYLRAEKYFSDLLSETDGTSVVQRDVYGEGRSKGRSRSRLGVPASGVKAFAEASGATENAFFQSVMGFVMSRFCYSGRSCHATVHSGRTGGRTSRLVGMLVKTLPVTFDINMDESPGALVRKTAEQLSASVRNDIYPFTEISAKAGVSADTMFVYQGILEGEGVRGAQMEIGDAQFPLTLQVYPDGDGFLADLEYDSSMYSEGMAESIISCFGRCAEGFLSASSLRDVEAAGPEDVRFLEEVDSSRFEYDRSDTVAAMFRRAARRDPGAVAVSFKGKEIAYGELDRVTDHLASYISSKGIGRDDFVAVLVPRSEAVAVATIGVVKSGAAYQPLDPTYPEERIRFMMEDARARLLIADRSLIGLVPWYKGEVLFTDEFESRFAGPAPDVSALSPSPGDAFIILYTSGTTGKPKGCVLEHRNLVAFLNWIIPEIRLGPGSRYASYASYGFDACMMDTHAALASGAALHIIPDEIRKDLGAIDAYYCDNGITHGFMTTQMGRMFMGVVTCRTLRYFGLGGEALVPLSPPDWLDLYNLYGPTETTVCVTSFQVKGDGPMLPIGVPNRN
ncbi:MAG: AMP-binding protein, partial [Candidatus Methanomethylophilaceae archaeon]|nr:AMP-binding protein [Candidatus Methanomethylophilaceae archaeon]